MKKTILLIIPLLFLGFFSAREAEAATLILRPDGGGDLTQLRFYGEKPVGSYPWQYAPDPLYNWRQVDEEDPHDGRSRYVFPISGVDYKTDLYSLQNLTVTPFEINSVSIYAVCDTVSFATQDSLKIILKTNNNIDESNEFTLLGTMEYNIYSEQWDVNPITVLPWTLTDINNLQIGISMRTTPAFTTCTQVYAVVDYYIPPNVFGYAWSENIGWIKFSGADYGVTINSNGSFSGYAWSENIGWISFAPAGPYPALPSYSAKVDVNTGAVSGWARALVYGDGWDGWIKMSGDWDNGVSINTGNGEFSGYAWSDTVIGWTHFKGVGYGVTTTFHFNQPPNKPTKAAETTWDNCVFLNKSIPTFYWTYIDPDNVPPGTDPQTGYIIEVDENAGFNPPIFHYVSPVGSTSYTLSVDWLDWNATYFWRVGVKDSHNSWSATSSAYQFKTPQEAYPYSGFTWEPEEPNQKEVVIFTPDDLDLSYFWIITEGEAEAVYVDSTGPTSPQPHIKFGTAVNKIKLRVTKDSYTCESAEYEITAKPPLPEYKEVAPTGWLGKILAIIVKVSGF